MLIELENVFVKCVCRVVQALELNKTNTKALFRRAQAWQGLKEYSQAMVTSVQESRKLKRNIHYLYRWITARFPP